MPFTIPGPDDEDRKGVPGEREKKIQRYVQQFEAEAKRRRALRDLVEPRDTRLGKAIEGLERSLRSPELSWETVDSDGTKREAWRLVYGTYPESPMELLGLGSETRRKITVLTETPAPRQDATLPASVTRSMPETSASDTRTRLQRSARPDCTEASDLYSSVREAATGVDRADSGRVEQWGQAGQAVDLHESDDTPRDEPFKRLSASVHSPTAVTKMEAYMNSHGISQTEFAKSVQVNERTIRRIRKTKKFGRDTLASVAAVMRTTPEDLLKEESSQHR